jgi:hypothetical protein
MLLIPEKTLADYQIYKFIAAFEPRTKPGLDGGYTIDICHLVDLVGPLIVFLLVDTYLIDP